MEMAHYRGLSCLADGAGCCNNSALRRAFLLRIASVGVILFFDLSNEALFMIVNVESSDECFTNASLSP